MRVVPEKGKSIIFGMMLVFLLVAMVVVFAGWQAWGIYQSSPDGLAARAAAAYRRLALDETIIYLKKAVELEPGNPKYRYNLAQALESTGAIEAAIEEYRKVLEIDPRLVSPRYNLAAIYLGQGEGEKSRTLLEEAVEIAPYFAAGRLLLGEIYQQQGNTSLALREYRAVIELGGSGTFDLAEVHFQMGNILWSEKTPVKALAAWKKALEINPGHAGAGENLKKHKPEN